MVLKNVTWCHLKYMYQPCRGTSSFRETSSGNLYPKDGISTFLQKMSAIICDNVKHEPLYLLHEWDLLHLQIHEMGKNIQPFLFYGTFLHMLPLQMVAFQQGIHNTKHPDSTSQPFHHGAYPEPFLVEGNPRYHTVCLSWKKNPLLVNYLNIRHLIIMYCPHFYPKTLIPKTVDSAKNNRWFFANLIFKYQVISMNNHQQWQIKTTFIIPINRIV